jgi:sec-independent protein translocase protein TatA
MGELGLPELLLILAIAVIIFGPRKLGELGKGLGEGIRGFRSALSGEKKEEPAKESPAEPKQP